MEYLVMKSTTATLSNSIYMYIFPASAYQSRAAEVYAEVHEQLLSVLPRARIEHIGASSVPGAASKGDIDVCVAVPKTEFDRAVLTIQTLGWRIKTDTFRSEQLCMLEGPRTDIPVSVQLIEIGSRFEFFFHFRDLLKSNPELLSQYNELKCRFAGHGDQVYRDEKAKFIHAALDA